MAPSRTSFPPSRARTVLLWVLAVVLTLLSAAWQRRTGPTYPVRGAVELGPERVELRLDRSHGGDGDQPVEVLAPSAAVGGEIAWRRFPSQDRYATVPLRREGDRLKGALPHQPPAGKLEYQLRLHAHGHAGVFPPRPAVTRFKGRVPAGILAPHVLAMFLSMLVSNRAGLEALAGGRRLRGLALATMVLLAAGGFVLGPIVQKHAFGAYWTGVPFGWDLTDNKTLIAGAAWAFALWRLWAARGGGRARLAEPSGAARVAVLVAALVMVVVFAIPHSTWGSEIRWDPLPATTP